MYNNEIKIEEEKKDYQKMKLKEWNIEMKKNMAMIGSRRARIRGLH